jgi:aspartate aminotransferase-like enzyme
MEIEQERIVISPGPVHVPRSLTDGIIPMHHRSDAFRTIMRETEAMLREILRTGSPVYIVTASGTGAMEAAAVNTVRGGESVLVVSGGKFGDRWRDIFEAYGCPTHVLEHEWGREIDIGAVIASVEERRPDIVACTHVESSTGLLLDLEGLAASLPEPRPLLVVDAIASVGAESFSMDEWGIDAVAAASQKALAAPPGIGIVALGERVRSASASRKSAAPRGSFYFDLDRYEAGRERGDAPFTPALHAIHIMHNALDKQRNAGWGQVMERHRRVSDAFIEASGHLGLSCFPERPSAAVQALTLPPGAAGKHFMEMLESRYGIIAAGGQGRLAGKVVRTGFLGIHGGATLQRIVSSFAGALSELGCAVDVRGANEAVGPVADLPELL